MINVQREKLRLERMTPTDLRKAYVEVFGEASHSGNKAYLIKRILWRMQVVAEGGLDQRLQRLRERALALARDADIRTTPPRDSGDNDDQPRTIVGKIEPQHTGEPAPGTVLVRDYKGRRIEVTVLSDGYEFEQKRYQSLTRIAREITGTKWNGRHFFGVAARPASPSRTEGGER